MNANVDYIIKTAIGEFNYLDYEGQHITATNSIEGHARSAILTGQTLVNIIDKPCSVAAAIDKNRAGEFTFKYVKPNTDYFVIYDITTDSPTISIGFLNTPSSWSNSVGNVTVYKGVLKLNSGANPNYFRFIGKQNATTSLVVNSIMVIEYQEGMENWDIPFFNGMQSVKMPVLTTTGKNLIDGTGDYIGLQGPDGATSTNVLSGDGSLKRYSHIVKCKPKTTYTLTTRGTANRCSLGEFVEYPRRGARGTKRGNLNTNGTLTITTQADTQYLVCYSYYRETAHTQSEMDEIVRGLKVQLEESSSATSYEVYKSSILSLPEEVVLRSLPNGVCDTLNVETGEYIQRIGEVVLNGNNNEPWDGFTGRGGLNYFRIPCPTMAENNREQEVPNYLVSDRIKFEKYKYLYESSSISENIVGATTKSSALGVQCIYVYYKNTDVIDTFKQHLQQNPITVQYQLAEPIIKTVDLSDNVVYSYGSTTHYSCSSEEGSLVPTLSVKVPTDTQLTIQEQKAATQTLLIKNMDLQQSIKEVQAMNLAVNTALYNSFNSIREEVEDIKKHVSTNENLEGSF